MSSCDPIEASKLEELSKQIAVGTLITNVETTAKLMDKHPEELDLKERRKSLFSKLDQVITLAEKKIHREKLKDAVVQKWCRILVSCIDSYGNLLEIITVDEMEERLDRLEQMPSRRGYR